MLSFLNNNKPLKTGTMNAPNVSASITAANKTTVQSDIADIKTLLPFLINLNAQQRKTLRKMGAKRLSYVQAAMVAVKANPNALPAAFNTADFIQNVQLVSDLTDIYNALETLFEGIDDTLKALGSEAMQEADEAYGYLKVAAAKNSNQALTTTVKNISDMLKHKTKVLSKKTPDSGSAK
jgi:hypothetical protein